MDKNNYKSIKEALKLEGWNVKYFSYKFYLLFLDATKKEDYSTIYNTKFYNNNSAVYCRFLEYAAEV